MTRPSGSIIPGLLLSLLAFVGDPQEHMKSIPIANDQQYSFVILPDTQAYSQSSPQVFKDQVAWIKENRVAHRICFVSHVGDLVKDNNEQQWNVANSCLSTLDGQVPYGISLGNWDMDATTGIAAWFDHFFPKSRFESCSWYGGGFLSNRNSYQLIDLGPHSIVWLHLECNAPDRVLDWANEVLCLHAERTAFVTTHMFLGPLERPENRELASQVERGVMRWSKCHGANGNSPEDVWQKCLSRHANVLLIFCGDQSRVQAYRQELLGQNGNRVQAMLSDYREGYLRLVRIDADKKVIRVWTYSPTLQQLCPGTEIAPDSIEHQFELPLDF